MVWSLGRCGKGIVKDRDKVFIFWRELFKRLEIKLFMSSVFHPQSNGQSKRVDQCLESYLRCMVMYNPRMWYSWLSLA